MTTPDPSPEFRSKLREEFVAGEICCSDTMVEAALEEWRMPRASEGFRNRCWDAFLGASTGARSAVRAAENAAVTAGGGNDQLERGRGRLLRFLPLAAAVAVGLFLVPGLLRGRFGSQKLGAASLVVNGQTVSDPTVEELERLVAIPHCRVAESGETVIFRYANDLLLEVDPGTEFSIEEPNGGLIALAIQLDKGALRLSSKPEFTQRVSVRTPEGLIFMRGEALGVDVMGDSVMGGGGTCICCLQGLAEVQPSAPDSNHFRVRSNDSLFLPRGSGEIKLMRDELHHRDPLVTLRESARTYYY